MHLASRAAVRNNPCMVMHVCRDTSCISQALHGWYYVGTKGSNKKIAMQPTQRVCRHMSTRCFVFRWHADRTPHDRLCTYTPSQSYIYKVIHTQCTLLALVVLPKISELLFSCLHCPCFTICKVLILEAW